VRIKTKALRQRIWYRAISRVERGIVDLTIRCVERIQSPVLARFLSEIIGKISQRTKRSFLERVNTVGKAIAQEISAIAERWGNEHASTWKHDSSFIRFLGVSSVNNKVTRI